MKKLTVADIGQWIDNDEGLYRWWKQSKKSKREFIRENRSELEHCIRQVTTGRQPAHYLAYSN